jgi:hypothetical protein
MKNNKTLIALVLSLLSACLLQAQEQDTCQERGTILHFNPDKCYGCWGWTIALKNDTIKTDDLNGGIFGYDFTEPLNIRVTVGERKYYGTRPTLYHAVLCAKKVE